MDLCQILVLREHFEISLIPTIPLWTQPVDVKPQNHIRPKVSVLILRPFSSFFLLHLPLLLDCKKNYSVFECHRTHLKFFRLRGREEIIENSMCPLWSSCMRHRLHNQPLRLNLVSFWRDICLFFFPPRNSAPLNETSSSCFSVFFIHFPQVYIFFGFTSFTADSFGLLEYFGICIVTDDSLPFPVFLPQVTPSPVGP